MWHLVHSCSVTVGCGRISCTDTGSSTYFAKPLSRKVIRCFFHVVIYDSVPARRALGVVMAIRALGCQPNGSLCHNCNHRRE